MADKHPPNLKDVDLIAFATESNLIEGITRKAGTYWIYPLARNGVYVVMNMRPDNGFNPTHWQPLLAHPLNPNFAEQTQKVPQYKRPRLWA